MLYILTLLYNRIEWRSQKCVPYSQRWNTRILVSCPQQLRTERREFASLVHNVLNNNRASLKRRQRVRFSPGASIRETANSETHGFVRPLALSPLSKRIRRKRRRKCARLCTRWSENERWVFSRWRTSRTKLPEAVVVVCSAALCTYREMNQVSASKHRAGAYYSLVGA